MFWISQKRKRIYIFSMLATHALILIKLKMWLKIIIKKMGLEISTICGAEKLFI